MGNGNDKKNGNGNKRRNRIPKCRGYKNGNLKLD